MIRRKFLLLILTIVIFLLFLSVCILYASVTSGSGDLVFPFFVETTTTDLQTPVQTTPAPDTTTEPIVEDKTYFITFYSGTTWLYTDLVKYGEMPIYVGKTPEKEPDEQYIYSFKGWSEQLEPATGSKSYTAVFSAIERTVSVVFKDTAGNVIQSKTVTYNSSVSCDNPPTSYSDERCDYSMVGWGRTKDATEPIDLSEVKTNMELYPVYEVTRHSSLVTFVNADGTILQQDFVKLGEKPKYKAPTPTLDSDDLFDYKFEAWDTDISPVYDEDIVYTALYIKEDRLYTVTFCNSKKGTIEQIKVKYGQAAIYPTDVPDITYGAYVYEFAYWAVSDTLSNPVDLSCITKDVIVFAYYIPKFVD